MNLLSAQLVASARGSCTILGIPRKILKSSLFNATAIVFAAAHALHMYVALDLAPFYAQSMLGLAHALAFGLDISRLLVHALDLALARACVLP